ncbi:MAG: hypothetical protein MAGBODY4_00077 [Candidatus Marinimicrobia bacterium]|nr:hypothetical protein [Candidatus Neomarinimicrobiota bacterium]
MTGNDEKQLLIIFVGVGVLLVGVLFWFLRSQTNVSAAAYQAAGDTFREQLPRELLKAGLDLQLEGIQQTDDEIPEIQFSYTPDENVSELTRRFEKVVSAEFSIIDRVEKGNIRAYGVAYKGKPLGRILLTRKAHPARATIGIIIDDFGYYNNEIIEGFLELSPKITFSVIPGHEYSQTIAREAAKRGFDVMIHMPMEPHDYSGGEEEFILKSGMPNREVIQRLERAFQELPMATGMNNHQGSLATEDPQLMQTVLHILKDKDSFFVDSYTTNETVGYELATKLQVPTAKRVVFLDNKPDTTYIKAQLEELVDKALEKGQAVGIGHNKKLTLEVLKRYIPYYEQQGIRFARISEVLEYPEVVL